MRLNLSFLFTILLSVSGYCLSPIARATVDANNHSTVSSAADSAGESEFVADMVINFSNPTGQMVVIEKITESRWLERLVGNSTCQVGMQVGPSQSCHVVVKLRTSKDFFAEMTPTLGSVAIEFSSIGTDESDVPFSKSSTISLSVKNSLRALLRNGQAKRCTGGIDDRYVPGCNPNYCAEFPEDPSCPINVTADRYQWRPEDIFEYERDLRDQQAQFNPVCKSAYTGIPGIYIKLDETKSGCNLNGFLDSAFQNFVDTNDFIGFYDLFLGLGFGSAFANSYGGLTAGQAALQLFQEMRAPILQAGLGSRTWTQVFATMFGTSVINAVLITGSFQSGILIGSLSREAAIRAWACLQQCRR